MSAMLTGCLLLGLLAGQAPEKGRCTVYMYLDAEGNSVRTRNWESIPPGKKDSVVTYQDCGVRPDKTQSFSYTQEGAEPAEALDESSILDWLRRRHRELERWQVIAVLIGLAMVLAGLIGISVTAFGIGVLWGLGVLLLPIVPVVFVIIHWRDTRASFTAWLLGWVLVGVFGYLV